MDKKQDFSALDKLGLIATKSFVTANRKIRNAVKNDTMLAVYATPGMGKTTINRITIGQLKESSRYVVTEILAFNEYHNIIGSIIDRMIDDMAHEKPRYSLMARIEQFKRVLMDTVKKGKKVVLVIDEAHRLSRDTLYGLKMIHEIGHSFGRENLFSIIFFGQPHFAQLIRPRELNLRIDRHEVEPLSMAEAEEYFRMRKAKLSEKSLQKIVRRAGLTPLGLKRACNVLLEISGGDRITDEAVRQYTSGDFSKALSSMGLTLNQLAGLIHQQTGERYDKSTLSKVINGNYDGKKGEELSDTIGDILAQRTEQPAGKGKSQMKIAS